MKVYPVEDKLDKGVIERLCFVDKEELGINFSEIEVVTDNEARAGTREMAFISGILLFPALMLVCFTDLTLKDLSVFFVCDAVMCFISLIQLLSGNRTSNDYTKDSFKVTRVNVDKKVINETLTSDTEQPLNTYVLHMGDAEVTVYKELYESVSEGDTVLLLVKSDVAIGIIPMHS